MLIEELIDAYYSARKNKRGTQNQLKFEIELEGNLVSLYNEIKERRYQVGRSTCFIFTGAVKREVFAADFRDRVVHHYVYNKVVNFFEKSFIYDCYSCRVGKGTLFGIKGAS